MKKNFLIFVFIIAYAIFFSLGLECLLNLLGMSMAISLDGGAVTKQYPRFIPFCIVTGFLALFTLIAIFVLNIKASERFAFAKKFWVAEIIIAFVISIVMIKPWDLLFEFLQKTL